MCWQLWCAWHWLVQAGNLHTRLERQNLTVLPTRCHCFLYHCPTRLNFAVGRGVLLLPSHMIINTESVVGYNNNLRLATDDMKLGVNNHVNQGAKKASLKLMAGGPSKVNPPNSHPSNPIHKQATEAQGIAPKPATQPPPVQPVQQPAAPATPQTTKPVDSHHVNKAFVAVGVLAVVGLIMYASSWAAFPWRRRQQQVWAARRARPGRRKPVPLLWRWSSRSSRWVRAGGSPAFDQ